MLVAFVYIFFYRLTFLSKNTSVAKKYVSSIINLILYLFNKMLLPHYNLFISGVIQTDSTNSYSCGIFKCLIHTWITFIIEQTVF